LLVLSGVALRMLWPEARSCSSSRCRRALEEGG